MRGFGKWIAVGALTLLAASCTVGPKYVRPTSAAAPNFKEPLPDAYKEMTGWKTGQPRDEVTRGKWWEIFGDPDLNALEEQIDLNNQNIAQAEASFRSARAAVRVARSGLFPQVTTAPSVSGSQSSGNTSIGTFKTSPNAMFSLPFDASWEADVWGKVRKGIEANIETAQASAGDLETLRLSLQAELALDYFLLHGQDAVKQLLDTTVGAYQKALDLTNNRYNQGVASQIDVTQARTQLEQTRAQSTDTQVSRAQLEHAIAILTGKPPSALTIPAKVIKITPPPVPVGIPSQLLERRPDIAANERRVAAANANVGVAQAAFYPDITLSAAGGLQGTSLVNLFTWPSHFWSLGSTVSYTLLDFGKRQGTLEQAQAAYDSAVAAYRQSVLQAFQDVEDNLSALRILDEEAREQAVAVAAAERSLELANNQYQGGITAYLQVITAQAIALNNEQVAVELLIKRQAACVALIKAIGGDFNVAGLPKPKEIAPWKGVQKVAEKVPAATQQ
ncbi:MAG TPA: efflux transporter outer membrane subunit [Bryobacteraceae bacterium]|nr:efflux transporter outer membrane subunit [Bryobacteraceae bacterium]